MVYSRLSRSLSENELAETGELYPHHRRESSVDSQASTLAEKRSFEDEAWQQKKIYDFTSPPRRYSPRRSGLPGWQKCSTTPRRATPCRPKRAIALLLAVFLVCAAALWVAMRANFLRLQPRVPDNPRKAVILASYVEQNVTWIDDLPEDWEIYRYFIDDPSALHHTPVPMGREAMSYLTYIIDHYYDLPDYMVFIHGHRRAWHQPEPMEWRLPSLNLEALERDQYISLHCLSQTSCSPAPRLDLTGPYESLDSTGRLLPWFWKYANFGQPLPDYMSWPDAAQFAVSRAAVQRRSRDWWIHYRAPMLVYDERMEHFHIPGYYWGLLHERLWHVAMGKPPIYCPDQDYCTKVQWSNAVHCDMYPALPIHPPWVDHKAIPDFVNCWKNEDPDLDHFMRPWSLCNETVYLQTNPHDCPMNGWPIP